ncbi:alpha/beta hydrolase [Pelagibius sp.]|uniref:alpha/beta hydrolase n=1 Tax=Pelagibius sp. TaxID=1931238 RepID=UPI0026103E7C|nr:alpha/beta hydrolase [Pelagibius sp.]
MRDTGKWLFKLARILAVAYVATVALMFALQTQLLFPTYMVSGSEPPMPASTIRLEVATPNGESLRGVHLPPARERSRERLVVLGFGGNAWNAGSLAVFLHQLFPEAEVVTFHYRGYEPSSGSPSAAALLADTPVVYDHVLEAVGAERVVAVGISIGASIAAELAAQRPLAGLILVTPFDSLEALARDHYPWVPVGWLLRHHMSTVESLRGLATPTALITAERDTVVPPRRTVAVRRAISSLVLDRTIKGAGHNDLFGRPDFREAMTEALARID